MRSLLDFPFQGDVLILTHDNPDPDSLSSSVALQFLLKEKKGISSAIAYSGVIGRAENRAMVELLRLPVVPLHEVDASQFKHVALVDAQPESGNHSASHLAPDIVIDHHPLRKLTRSSAFYDVQPELGASATLLTEYLRESGTVIPETLATALLYGISSETQDLGREVSSRDVAAYEHLFPLADRALLSAISRPRLKREYFQQLADALSGILVVEQIAVSMLGEVIDPDFVPEIADLAVRMEGVRWALATGAFGSKIHVSIRTDDAAGNAGELMQTILKGMGSGGGHGMRGGGNVNLRFGDDRQAVERDLADRFAKALGEKGEQLRPYREL